jgi:hypothetical protein
MHAHGRIDHARPVCRASSARPGSGQVVLRIQPVTMDFWRLICLTRRQTSLDRSDDHAIDIALDQSRSTHSIGSSSDRRCVRTPSSTSCSTSSAGTATLPASCFRFARLDHTAGATRGGGARQSKHRPCAGASRRYCRQRRRASPGAGRSRGENGQITNQGGTLC